MIDHTIYAIGMALFGVILATGIGLSAWKGEFSQKEIYCSGCHNINHWSPEAKIKYYQEQKNVALQQ